MKHPTVTLLHPDFGPTEIDEDIAPLIQRLWDLGWETLNSCQDNVPTGYIWIEFLLIHMGQQFLTRVMGEDTLGPYDGLYNRMLKYSWDEKGEEPLWWQYHVHADNFGMVLEETDKEDEVEYVRIGPNEMVFSLSVRFPRSDLPTVMERLQSPF
jgi:hypothetical protein